MSHEAGPLELATTLELVDELERRFPLGVLLVTSGEVPGAALQERFEMFRRCRISLAIGLVNRANWMLREEDRAIPRDFDEDDGP